MEPGRPSGDRPWFASPRFSCPLSVGYLALVAFVLSNVTDLGFLSVFLAVVAGTAFCAALAILWLSCWALRKDLRGGQFGLASLFFLTAFAAIYLGAIRWLVVHYTPSPTYRTNDSLGTFVALVVTSIFLAVFAGPFLIVMGENVVWAAVWIVRRPIVQRWLRRRRSGRDEQ